ncbi:uncharacterized protein LOC129619010 [Condylostylus longicornis]|uniref:uncharacterized protein LOC129619010 n=1 Tax=Condylostylus longicornis TaxID=2530218 RepID=UPI00244E4949|nr:uncharacterized protein LOC129619010 [Condylostylus longicornis]
MALEPNTTDVLQLLSKNDLENIFEILKANLPRSIRDHHYLFHYLKNYNAIKDPCIARDLSATFKPTFYGPRKRTVGNCTFIAIGEKTPTDYWIFLSTQEENGEELIDCLKKTKLIDWFAEPIYFSCDKKYYDKIYEILKINSNKWIVEEPEGVYYLSKFKVNLFPDAIIPKTYCIKKLNAENANVIDDNWSAKYAGSLKLITSSIQLNGGLGLFNERDEMITWMVTNELMCPGFLTVIESERRKGFGELITKEEFKRFVSQYDIDICVRVLRNNLVSSHLMLKLGSQKITEEIWIGKT